MLERLVALFFFDGLKEQMLGVIVDIDRQSTELKLT